MGLSLVGSMLSSMLCSVCSPQPASSVPELVPCAIRTGEGIWLGIQNSLGRRPFTYPVQQGWDLRWVADGGLQAVGRSARDWSQQKVMWSSHHPIPEERTLGWQGGGCCPTVHPVVSVVGVMCGGTRQSKRQGLAVLARCGAMSLLDPAPAFSHHSCRVVDAYG